MARRPVFRWNEGEQRWMAWVRFADGSRRMAVAQIAGALDGNRVDYRRSWSSTGRTSTPTVCPYRLCHLLTRRAQCRVT
jgi:hypothetical protein